MDKFAGRVALVTGGASGVGRATTLALLRAGASVGVIDRDRALLASLEQEAGDAAQRLYAATGDVTNEADIEGFVATSATRLGAPDLIVTAAGIQHYGDAVSTSRWEWDRVFSVNVTGSFLAIRAALPSLREQANSAIVVVSSVQSIGTQRDVAAYTASKGALTSFVRSLAVDEARHGVRANSVLPGSVDTPMLRASARKFSDGSDAAEQQLVEAWGRSHPLGRVAQPDEVASAILFLLGSGASFITGASLPVDGGLLASLAVGLPE
jgi:NAD(P)-dependent dehydrogenase (short-subunit alcohol dehydrogenase family)